MFVTQGQSIAHFTFLDICRLSTYFKKYPVYYAENKSLQAHKIKYGPVISV